MSQSDKFRKISNQLLRSLPSETLSRLLPHLEPVELARGRVIDYAGKSITKLHFIDRGLVSLVKTMRDGRTVEIGTIGIEGAADPKALVGVDRAHVETIVQVPGQAFRIERSVLMDVMERDDALRDVIRAYVGFVIGQIVQTAACNRLHSLEERCCRWLLIAHDSALCDTFPLTHEFLAMMLGTQRAGVSISASCLKKAGLISYRHGQVTILDRVGLEHASCECYETQQAERKRLFRL